MRRSNLVVLTIACGMVLFGALSLQAAEAVPAETAQLVQPVEGLDFTQPLAFQSDTTRPGEPTDPTEPLPANVWCCKPDGNCAKIKPTKCANIGGVQHTTQAACLNDPNC